MEIKLSIKQDDIEQAIRDYVASKGITTPVRAINFVTSRKGGFSIGAEVEVSEVASEEADTVVPEVPEDVFSAPVAEEAPSAKPTPKTKPKPKAVETTKPKVVEADLAEAKAEPAPWVEDAKAEAANDAETPTPAPAAINKSLFGS